MSYFSSKIKEEKPGASRGTVGSGFNLWRIGKFAHKKRDSY
jgi:hypothetical protein